MSDPVFESFARIPRLIRECWVSEKIDGTNAQILIQPVSLYSAEKVDGGRFPLGVSNGLEIFAGSRNRWLSIEADNYGFAKWVQNNADELVKLGPGRHYGEWWGCGIQRGYGLTEKRFSLFNAGRWSNPETTERPPACCGVVPILYRGEFETTRIESVLSDLKTYGSVVAPGFFRPEGIVIYHTASKQLYKKTIEHDAQGKPE